MKKKNQIYVGTLTDVVKVIEQDLTDDYGIDVTAWQVLMCLEDKVSPELMELLGEMLLAFDGEMQLEMADDLLDFACGHVIHTTGCPSADVVLKACYSWIAEEQGFGEEESREIILNL